MLEGAIDGELALSEAMMIDVAIVGIELVPNVALEKLVTDGRVVFRIELARDRFVGRITRRMVGRKRGFERRHLGRLEGLRLGRLELLLATMSVDGWKSRFGAGYVETRVFREAIGMSIDTGVVERRIHTGFRKIGNVHGWVLFGAVCTRARMVRSCNWNRGGAIGGRSYHNRIWVTEILSLAVVAEERRKIVGEFHLHVSMSYGDRLIKSVDGR